jgi:hypothetical protein
MSRRTPRAVLAVSCALQAALAASTAFADTLSIANASPSAASVAITAGLLDGGLPAADWADGGGTGISWHGTVAVTLFNRTGTWTTTAGSHSLAVATSGTYTGALSQAYYVVTVTGDTGTSINATVTGSESGTISAGAHGANLAVGTKGVTIRFATGTTYASGDSFTLHAGNLPASAMKLHSATGSITVTSGTMTKSFKNDGVTVSGNTPTAPGGAVAFITATDGSGSGGIFRVIPGMEIVYDQNRVWAGAYVATVSYSILTGP